MGIELVGVSLNADTGPFQNGVHLRFDTSVVALYGLNGAGKSQILRGVRAALTGVRDRSSGGAGFADLHIRVSPGESWLTDLRHAAHDHLWALRAAAIRNAFESQNGVSLFEPGHARPQAERSLEGLVRARFALGADDPSAPWQGLLRELGESFGTSTCWTLRATGRSDHPMWQVAPSLPISEEPAWESLLDEVASECEATRPRANPASAAATLDADGLTTPYVHTYIPQWVPVPSLIVGTIRSAPVAAVDAAAIDSDLDTATGSFILAPVGRAVVEAGIEDDDWLPDVCAALSGQVTFLLRLALPMAPELCFDVPIEPEEFLTGGRATWCAVIRADEDDRGIQVSLDSLSSAQARWARLLISVCLAARDPGLPTILICDEPEAGLHPLAERGVAALLPALTTYLGVKTVVATHSPHLLNKWGTGVWKVSREATRIRAAELSLPPLGSFGSELARVDLGLRPGDLLSLMGMCLIVEGEHDRIVLNSLLADAITLRGAAVLPLRGASGLKSFAESELLWHGTDAPFLIILDSAGPATDAWASARKLFEKGDFDAVRFILERLADSKQQEQKWLAAFGRVALENMQLNRVSVFGLSEPDIICYLPFDTISSRGGSWTEILDAWRRSASDGRPTNLKRWLHKNRYTSQEISVEDVERATTEAAARIRLHQEELPAELLELSEVIRATQRTGSV